jgi:hypothetical protein
MKKLTSILVMLAVMAVSASCGSKYRYETVKGDPCARESTLWTTV